ncbi:MAG: nucleoside transporter C-terminal domain-containing protein, partial [Desulfobacterium sp.]
KLKIIFTGLLIQLLLAVILLKLPLFRQIFITLNGAVLGLVDACKAGTSMVFGYLGGGALPFSESFPGASYILAFQALPLLILMSAISSLLFYWRILPALVKVFSWVLKKTFGLGGAEGVGVSANIFVGMIEAPLFIRPYFSELTRSELFSLMTTGMATIAGTVMVLYATLLKDTIPDVLGHILVASIISAPAAITVAKTMIPETLPVTSGDATPPETAASSMDAVTQGTTQGVQLFINVVAMLMVLVALVYIVDLFLGLMPHFQGEVFTLKRLLGWIMAPVAWLMGIPWHEAHTAGSLMGTKTILNEFLAYMELGNLPKEALSPNSRLILTYAMCGFANPGSLGIMIGGMGTMAPDRRSEIASLGIRAVLAGTIATCMTGAIVGLITAMG